MTDHIMTWRERIGASPGFTLYSATDVERAMAAEIAELRRRLKAASTLGMIRFDEALNLDATQDKLLTIIAAAYQIAGAHGAPAHVLDVLARPNDATDAQVAAMLPYVPALLPPVSGVSLAPVPPQSALSLALTPPQSEVSDAPAPTTSQGSMVEDVLSTLLWLYRRLPRCYGRPPFIEHPIQRLADKVGIKVDADLNERGPAQASQTKQPGATR